MYSSSRNPRDFNHEIRAQSETRLHREYNLVMKNKSLRRSQPRKEEGASHGSAARQERDAFLKGRRPGTSRRGSGSLKVKNVGSFSKKACELPYRTLRCGSFYSGGRICAGIRFGNMSACADPNPALSSRGRDSNRPVGQESFYFLPLDSLISP